MKRGMFRIWLCVSVLWTASVLLASIPSIGHDTTSPEFHTAIFTDLSHRTPTLEDAYRFLASPDAQALIDAPQVTNADPKTGITYTPVKGNPFAPWPALIVARIADMLIWCASLPLILLAISTTMTWIVRGFRHQ